jgi:16S rRNA A1518/A1519 N6-dimethyltransferase RsmA/KsgA/DIM1 with predicted DNA glycosylase/AP lyase activity
VHLTIPAGAFRPRPRTDAAVITLIPKRKEELLDDAALYLFRELLEQRDKKMGNALREALIRWAGAHDRPMTKREVKRLMAQGGIARRLLEARLENLSNAELAALTPVLRRLATDTPDERS